MMREAEMPANDENPEEKKKKQKKYLWFGYGDYSGITGAFNPTNVRADPNIIDRLFEIFGVKAKIKEEPEKDR